MISFSVDASNGEGGGLGIGLKYGYYTQATSQGSSGNAVQVGYTGWLIKSDGTCYYCGYLEDVQNASDFRNESAGTYTYSGGKISMTISNPMGTFTNTYSYSGGNLYYGSTLAYKWVRGE